MKNLYNYIAESRGIVTGKDDWSNLVKFISVKIGASQRNMKTAVVKLWGNDVEVPSIEITKKLPDWISKCHVYICPSKYSAGMAWVEPENMKLDGDKVIAEIYINEKYAKGPAFRDSLDHELQHLYDNYKSAGKKINGKYHVNPGHDEPDVPIGAICHGNLEYNVILELFKYYTDFCHEFEWSAYLRNFNSFLKTKSGEKISFDDVPYESGLLPVFVYKLFNILLSKVDDMTDINVEDTLYYLDQGYLKRTKIKPFTNLKMQDRLKAIIKYILEEDSKKMIRNYKRCMDDNDVKYDDDLFDNTITKKLKTKQYID